LLLYPAACLLLLLQKKISLEKWPLAANWSLYFEWTVFWLILNRPSILLCIHVLTQLVYFIFLLLERAWHDSFCVCSSSWEYVSVSTVAGASIFGRRDISTVAGASITSRRDISIQTDSSPVRKVVLRFFWRCGHFSDGISSIQYSKFHINFFRQRNSFPWKRDMQELNFQVLFIIFTRNFSKHAWRLNMAPPSA